MDGHKLIWSSCPKKMLGGLRKVMTILSCFSFLFFGEINFLFFQKDLTFVDFGQLLINFLVLVIVWYIESQFPNHCLRTYPPDPHKLSILPNTHIEYHQVEYWKKYSTFSTDFTYLIKVEYFFKYVLNLSGPGGQVLCICKNSKSPVKLVFCLNFHL